MKDKRPSLIRRALAAVTRTARERDVVDHDGPKVDLLRQRVTANRKATDADRYERELEAILDPDSRPEPEPINLFLPVRRESASIDVAIPVELRRGPEAEILALVEAETAIQEGIIPYRLDELTRTLCLAIATPLTKKREEALVALLRPRLGYKPRLSTWTTSDAKLQRLLRMYYSDRAADGLTGASESVGALGASDGLELLAPRDDGRGETHDFIVNLLRIAVDRSARDIIISPHIDETKIFLIDESGRQPLVLESNGTPRPLPRSSAPYLARVVKLMCDRPLDVLNTRDRQPGTITRHLTTSRGVVEVQARVNVVPKDFGENITIRLFADDVDLDFETLVTCPFNRQSIRWAVDLSDGVLLFASPPASGKSTLQHAILRPPMIRETENILTIENPIERRNPFLEQYPVTERMSQDVLLDAHMQSSPDRLMVGEITRASTAQLVFHASRSGIQVFSTVHSMSAAAAVRRLLDLCITRDEIANDVRVLVAQRLLPVICLACKESAPVTPEELLAEQFHIAEVEEFVPAAGVGDCNICKGTGVDGRVGIVETLPFTDDVRAIIRTAPLETLDDDLMMAMIEMGGSPLRRHAIELVRQRSVPLDAIRRMDRMTEAQRAAWWKLHRRPDLRLLKGAPADLESNDEKESR